MFMCNNNLWPKLIDIQIYSALPVFSFDPASEYVYRLAAMQYDKLKSP